MRQVTGTVTSINVRDRAITISQEDGITTLRYDRLILAAGSQLDRPNVSGLASHAFDIDTWDEAAELNAHLHRLADRPPTAGRNTVLIIGGGLTGIELACEMPERLRECGIADGRVLLADRNLSVGSDMGEDARRVIVTAMKALGVEARGGVSVTSLDSTGADLAIGKRIATETIVWTAGMRASPLATLVPSTPDRLGRLPVDATMRVVGIDGVFAAGDIAAAPLPGGRSTVMSCQFARPMGRFAGHNAVADLLGHNLLAMNTERYVTCLDLGSWGALFTEGWDRRVSAYGSEAKQTKTTINRVRIYPPRSRNRRELLDAAAPIVQAPPPVASGRS